MGQSGVMSGIFHRFERYLDRVDRCDQDLSAWSVGMHIDHCLRVGEAVAAAVEDSVPGKERRTFSLLRLLAFTFNWIPRGRARAPAEVQPDERVGVVELRERLGSSASIMDRLTRTDPAKTFTHFAFGTMGPRQALRFLEVHNTHHEKIIRDILAAG